MSSRRDPETISLKKAEISTYPSRLLPVLGGKIKKDD